MTNHLNGRPFNNNAELNTLIEDEQRLKSEQSKSDSKQSTDGSSSGAGVSKSSDAVFSKKSGNKNALRHGGYFNGLLPWESPEEFDALHKSFREDLKPDGALQEEVVLSLTQWTWKRRRVLQSSQISYFRSPVASSLKSGEITWDDVIQYQTTVPEKIDTLISADLKLADSLSRVSDKIGEHYYWTNTSEGKEIQLQLSKMRQEIASLSSTVRARALDDSRNLRKAAEEISNLFDLAYQPEEIEKNVRLLSMIDREIDRETKRLIFLKTFKSVEAADEARRLGSRAQPLLESPSVVPVDTSTVKPADTTKGPDAPHSDPVAVATPESTD